MMNAADRVDLPDGIRRDHAIQMAHRFFDDGHLFELVRRRVRLRTESPRSGSGEDLELYLRDDIAAQLRDLGFRTRVVGANAPCLIAERVEAGDLPTVLIYGHGDTTPGDAELWREGLAPFDLVIEDGRWYGRGAADNKGQHTINLCALALALQARGGRLGFNVKVLMEMEEEIGSPQLRAICEAHAGDLASDVLIASDGPRIHAEHPTLFLGARGIVNFDLVVDLRERTYHSGNWGGVLSNPGTILANAIASLVDGKGRITLDALRPPEITPRIRELLTALPEAGTGDDPPFDLGWGEPGLTGVERLYAWNALEVLTFRTGDADNPKNAIPGSASARIQLRFVVGTDVANAHRALRSHFDATGFEMVELRPTRGETMAATRLDPDEGWVAWAAASMQRTSGKKTMILPNLGGSLPNDVFANLLGLPTLWVPHSYPGCGQHGPDEHLLADVAREGLAMMTGLFWDLGVDGPALVCEPQTV